MQHSYEDLSLSLHTGFIDKAIISQDQYQPNLLLNDKSRGKKVLSAILKELKHCNRFWFSVAFLTKSGMATLMNTLKVLEDEGIKGKVLVSQYLNFTHPEALKTLLKFNNIETRISITDAFHSKGYLFKRDDHYNLIVGSSNLTANALCSNKELNLKISATPQSKIIRDVIQEFQDNFDSAEVVSCEYISKYEDIYLSIQDRLSKNKLQLEDLSKKQSQIDNKGVKSLSETSRVDDDSTPIDLLTHQSSERSRCRQNTPEFLPNKMQVEALANLKSLREKSEDKALLISATGTGKTHLSAFDAKQFGAQKVLFVVHRANIAKAALVTFRDVFGSEKSMGLYSGGNRSTHTDFIFCTIQTISKDQHMNRFSSDQFDYIIIDETHRAGADTYQKIIEYFTPKFLLGMTATPERTDGFNIFKVFEHNIAYEIRLHNAMEENMLSSFHYYGVTDISVNGEVLAENSDFNILVSDERVSKIIEKAEFYGCDNGIVRGLIFCSQVQECLSLSASFNNNGYKTIPLSGQDNEEAREAAIQKLESDNPDEKIDYIFTVDIFNEGIDIPKVNQIIMLRPTQSAIIFVQQLGRGLRKAYNKDFLTVIDFIGNYQNNFLVPIALYGDTSYNKDTLRKCMASGSTLLPGASTINFDQISHKRIFDAIDSANMSLKKDLVRDYSLLKYKIGYPPMMLDFLDHGSRDPKLFVDYSKSYFNFVNSLDGQTENVLNPLNIELLQFFAIDINNGKRIEECLVLMDILSHGFCNVQKLKSKIKNIYGYLSSPETLISTINNLNFKFIRKNQEGTLVSVCEKYKLKIVIKNGESIFPDSTLKDALEDPVFKRFLIDNVEYSIRTFTKMYNDQKFYQGFVLYQKYSRKDVFRILNWSQNPVAQNVGGYCVSKDKSNCPLFINYHKEEGISETTKYEDRFINNSEFIMMSKSRRTLKSQDVQDIKNYRNGLRLPLFIKKSNDEGVEFYYMGEVVPIDNRFEQTSMPTANNKEVSVVKINFRLNHSVEDSMYYYITHNN